MAVVQELQAKRVRVRQIRVNILTNFAKSQCKLIVLEDMAICMSKCAPNVVNGTGVKSGVSWMPDGVSLII